MKLMLSNVLIAVSNIEKKNSPEMFEEFNRIETKEQLFMFNESLKEDQMFSKMVILFSPNIYSLKINGRLLQIHSENSFN